MPPCHATRSARRPRTTCSPISSGWGTTSIRVSARPRSLARRCCRPRGQSRSIGDVVGRLLAAYFDDVNRTGGIYNRRIVLKTAEFNVSDSAVDALRRLTSDTDVFAVVAPVVFRQNDPFAAFTESAALP